MHAVRAEQLGSHVARRASLRQRGGGTDFARLGGVGTVAVAVDDRNLYVPDPPRQTEPAQLQPAVLVDEHVGGLQVAVQHARLVRDPQGGDEVEREPRDAPFGQTLVLLQDTEQVAADAVLQNQPQVIRGFVPGVEFQHERRIRRAKHLHFAQHARTLALVHALDGIVLDGLLATAFIHRAVLTLAYGLVDVVPVHRRGGCSVSASAAPPRTPETGCLRREKEQRGPPTPPARGRGRTPRWSWC